MERAVFLSRLRELLADDELTEEDPIAPKTWDSLEVLSTIELLDKAGRQVKVGDILNCNSVSELVELACANSD